MLRSSRAILQGDSTAQASSALSACGSKHIESNRVGTAVTLGNDEDRGERCSGSEEEDKGDPEWLQTSETEGGAETESFLSNKRKRRMSTRDRNRAKVARGAGAAQVTFSDLRGNGREARSSASAFATGVAQVSRGRAGISCECEPLVQKIVSRLPEAELTSADRRSRKGAYSYKRLGEIVLESVFDAGGNWVVHRKCIAPKLPVSPAWLSGNHARAVELARAPCSDMRKSDIIGSTPGAIDGIIANIIIPAHVNLPPRRFFAAQSSEYVFSVVRRDKNGHGLNGKPSNRSRKWERIMFGEFIRAERTPNGRTTAKDGRTHGAMFYLNSLFKSIRCASNKPEDQASSLAWTFNDGLRKIWGEHEREKQYKPLSKSTILAWLVEDFGPRKRVAGIAQPSDQHTTLYPHKTDACAFCESTGVTTNSLRQQEKRHLQQHDQGSLTRQQSLQEVRAEMKELEEILHAHKQEAARAIKHHKSCIEGAENGYTELCAQFDAVLATQQVSDDGTRSVNDTALNVFLKATSQAWFEISSDYQQDKAVPSWNDSPQPGMTYYMSGITYYVHIFCFESCGIAAGDTRFSRNLVYTREETVGGAKTSDDTLSTLTRALLGCTTVSGFTPPIYRNGYNENGLR